MSFEKEQNYLYELEAVKELFYNEDSRWGVFSFKFIDDADRVESGIQLDPRFKTFVISGTAPQLKTGEKRHIAFKDHMDDKYGKGYQFVEVKSTGLKTPEAQAEFLRQMISETQADSIIETYPPNNTYLKDLVDGKYDLTVIYGIKEKRQQQIISEIEKYEDYQVAIFKLAPIGAGIKSIKRLVNHFGTSEELVEVLESDIYQITKVDGFGFKKVDDLALKLGYDRESHERLVAGAAYVLEQMSEKGDTKIPVEDFDAEMCKILEISEVTDELFETIMSNDRFFYEDGFICLRRLRAEEMSVAQKIARLAKEVKPLEGLIEIKDEIIKKKEEENGFSFTEQQKELIEKSLVQGVTVLTGTAGSGKSFSVKTIVDIYQEAGYTPVAMALSGKAAQVLIENGILNTGTIHRKLMWSSGSFAHNEREPLENELVIIDEASMINNSLFKSIIDAIKIGSRVLIIGDNAQLPPIGHGAVFETLLSSELPVSRLTQIHRQAAKSGIITVANQVRKGEQVNNYGSKETQIIGELKDMRIFNYIDKSSIYNDIMATVSQYLKNPMMNPEDLQVITAMKRGALGVPELNKGIQNILNPHPKNGKLPSVITRGQELRKGDRVIQNGNLYKAMTFKSLEDNRDFKNYYESDVFNGTIGYISEVSPSSVLVRFEDYLGERYVHYSIEAGANSTREIHLLDLAYAITVHRSQGSGFKTILFTFDYSAFMLLSKEFVYTGITRAIDNCLMYVENTALHHAINVTHSSNRRTYLKEFLEEALEENEKSLT